MSSHPTDRPQSARLAILVPFAIVTLIWGSTWIVIRDQLGVVPASWSVSYRFALGGLVMLLWALVRGDSLRLGSRGLAFAAALGLSQFVLNFNLVYRAEQHITSGLVAVIYALLVVPNAIFGRIFLGQRLGRQLLLGSAIGLVGVALLFIHEARLDPQGESEALTGIGLSLLGVLCASVANIMQGTGTARDYPMATMMCAAMLIGAGLDAAFAWWTVGPPTVDLRIGYFAGVAFLGIFGSAIAFTLYFGVIRTIGPAKAAYSGALVPVIAMLFSTLLEGYRWSLLAASGAVLVLAGLVIALSARRPNR